MKRTPRLAGHDDDYWKGLPEYARKNIDGLKAAIRAAYEKPDGGLDTETFSEFRRAVRRLEGLTGRMGRDRLLSACLPVRLWNSALRHWRDEIGRIGPLARRDKVLTTLRIALVVTVEGYKRLYKIRG